ncbi:hypothetical protein [Vibrio salinus]|uniref:hypothetical protein n=1 Tax=Vibrio salinus TaxID=2899784 RepID=UPI001E314FEF|nr:hypothetical protein [Vibrio salinus]MCE0495106.1 hypothetical protein [Vibrio salinus]
MSILDNLSFRQSKFIAGFVVFLSFTSVGALAKSSTDVSDTAKGKYDLGSYTALQAYEAGKLMRAQFKDSLARPYLKYSADKGNADAAYLYAMDVLSDSAGSNVSDLAKKYLIKSANGGQLNASYFLYKNGTWFRNATRLKYRNLYHDGSIELAAKKPGKASYDLYLYYKDLNDSKASYYLKKAQEYDYPSAILNASIKSYNDQNNPVINSLAIKNVEKIAKEGFIPAIRACVDYYENKNDFKTSLEWKEIALQHGDLMSLASLAKIYAGLVSSYKFVKPDLIKANAYLSMYIDNAGKNHFSYLYGMVEDLYSDVSEKMTKEQKSKAKLLVNKYKDKVVFYNYDTLWDI